MPIQATPELAFPAYIQLKLLLGITDDAPAGMRHGSTSLAAAGGPPVRAWPLTVPPAWPEQ